MIDRKILIRRLTFALYFVIAFVTFLVVLFPFDRIKSRLESEVRTGTQMELNVARISPRFLNRFVLSDVVLSDRTGRVLFESPASRPPFPRAPARSSSFPRPPHPSVTPD